MAAGRGARRSVRRVGDLAVAVAVVVALAGGCAAESAEPGATSTSDGTSRPSAQSAQPTQPPHTPGDPCVGPGALVEANSCESVQGTGPLIASPAAMKAQLKDRLLQQCQASIAGTELRDCVVGDRTDPTETVALVGDSHAISFLRMADELGKRRGWKVVVHGKGSCPSSDAVRTLAAETALARRTACQTYNRAVDAALLEDRTVTRILASSYTARYGWLPYGGTTDDKAGEKGFATRFARWLKAGKKVTVIADVPSPREGLSVPECVAANPDPGDSCTTPRATAVPVDLAVAAARAVGAQVVDLTDLFCDDATCYGRVGDVIVYRDTDHLSFEYAALLAPFVDERLG
ncbi:hypothetical protein LL946_02060 [Knoellia locipacati]|uniref:SGNH hydrolase domain-containing protein n=1 Tax=Knoellia locipacati TaxID=882824 RepID=UPI00385140FC